MEAQQYKKNAVEIIALADGMTEVQWSRIQQLVPGGGRQCTDPYAREAAGAVS